MYALIVLVILMIAIINIQPFKKTSVRYPSTDPIFMVLLSLVYVALLGRGIVYDTRHHALYYVMTMLGLVMAIVPILYINVIIGSWLLSRSKCIINKQ